MATKLLRLVADKKKKENMYGGKKIGNQMDVHFVMMGLDILR